METDGALVIDLRRPDWADGADTMLASFAAETPKALCFEANDAAAPSAEEAQLIFALTNFAEALDVTVSLSGLADELVAGLHEVGLTSIFPAEGDCTQ